MEYWLRDILYALKYLYGTYTWLFLVGTIPHRHRGKILWYLQNENFVSFIVMELIFIVLEVINLISLMGMREQQCTAQIGYSCVSQLE